MSINPTKKQRARNKAREIQRYEVNNEIKAQVHEDANDARKLEQILKALVQVDANTARDIITHSAQSVLSLIQPKGGAYRTVSGLTCKYALHAVLVALIGEDCQTILNSMSHEDILFLKEAISTAQKFSRPQKDETENEIANLEKQIKSRVEIRHEGDPNGNIIEVPYPLTQENHIMLQRKLKAEKVALQFVKTKEEDKGGIWDEVVAELQRWADAITVIAQYYEKNRAAQKTAQPKQKQTDKELLKTQDMLLKIPQVAERLGTTPKKIYAHISRCLNGKNQEAAAKVNKLFIFKTVKGKKQVSGLPESCFEEYKKLFAMVRKYNRKPKTVKQQPVAQPKVEKPAKPQKVAHKDYTDVKAAEAIAKALKAMLKEAITKTESSKAKRNDITAQMQNELDTVKFDALTDQVKQANAEVAEAEKEQEAINSLVEQCKQKIKTVQDAESALLAAQADLFAFIESAKQIKR